MSWQPMMTAPKDKPILLLAEDTFLKNGRHVTEGQWDAEGERWSVVWFAVHGCGCCGGSEPDLLGWAPLPALEAAQ